MGRNQIQDINPIIFLSVASVAFRKTHRTYILNLKNNRIYILNLSIDRIKTKMFEFKFIKFKP